MAPDPLRIDLSGVTHSIATSRPETCSSSRSTEFQTVLDGFTSLKVQESKPEGVETTKCVDENVDEKRLLHKRRDSTELTPGDVVREFSQQSQRGRRASLPTLGLVAVDIQYSVPSKRNPGSYPENLSSAIVGSGLHSIKEIPEKGAKNAAGPRHFKGASSSKTSLSINQPAGNSSLLRRRRFSLGAQRNMKFKNSAFGLPNKQRRASCSTCVEEKSSWCVKVHHRTLSINDDWDKPHSHGIQPGYRQLQTRRASLPSVSSFTGQPFSSSRYGILPRIGRKNSLVGEPDEQS